MHAIYDSEYAETASRMLFNLFIFRIFEQTKKIAFARLLNIILEAP